MPPALSPGPLFYVAYSDSRARLRLIAITILAASSAVLFVALRLKPSPTGIGTHQQLLQGTPPCTLVVLLGYPCPTCGMTTAFAHGVRGQWLRAFHAQPAGFLLFLGTIAAVGLSLGALVTGRTLRLNARRLTPVRIALIVVGFLAAGWAYKLVAGLLSGTVPYR